jgi:hypothetical protein
MSYIGETYPIDCNRGGLTYSGNVDMVTSTDMLPPSRNINLDEAGRRKRGGTAKGGYSDYDAVISGTPQIMGIYYFRLRDGTDYIIVAGKDGKIYRAHDTTIKASGMSTSKYFDFETFANELYICDGENVPELWTGTGNTSTLTDIPADWTGANNPQWVIKHGRGNSERLWFGGVASEPQRIYASANGDGDDISDANNTTLDIETGDGFGIIGAIEFGDRLIGFGKQKSYIIDDLDVDTSNWGYDAAQWDGGVCNFRCIVKIPNDIICMMEDGEIYSVRAAEQYGDYRTASLIRPSFMHRYIKEFINLSKFDQFHGIYDHVLRAVKYFVCRSGQTENDAALVYFIDRPVNEAWIVHDNQDNASGYDASAACLVRESAGVWTVFTGDYGGEVWELEQVNRNDNSEAYYGGFKTPNDPFGNPRARKNYPRGWVLTKPQGNWDLSINKWVDGKILSTTSTVSLSGTGGLLGSFTLGTDVLGGNEIIDKPFSISANGKRLQLEIYNTTVNQDFFVSRILVDHKLLGSEAD